MAVASSAAVSPTKTTTKRKRKTAEQENGVEMKMGADDSNPKKQDLVSEDAKQLKRTKSPGVRVVGKRVYDSENGKTCHQCRQKTLDFAASCKNIKNDKQCTMKLCHKCLLNRYGEKAEEVAVLDNWKCPKCRGICNCSFCMKKRGCQPTGILVHTAKASGFSSVSEMLHVKSPTSLSQDEIAKNKNGIVAFPRKLGKENNIDGTCNTASGSQLATLQEKKFKKIKELTETRDAYRVENDSIKMRTVKKVKKDLAEMKNNRVTGSTDVTETKNGKRANESTETCDAKKVKKKNLTEMKNASKVKVLTQTGDGKEAKRKELTKSCETKRDGYVPSSVKDSAIPEEPPKKKVKLHRNDHDVLPAEKPKEEELLPYGTELTSVAEVDLPSKDVGNALQFIQFCYTFGEVLEIRKGQAGSILRDIMFGRNRRGKVSSFIHFQIQLLTLIRKDLGEESSLSPTDDKQCWLHALKECVTESEWAAKDLAALNFDKTDSYDMLSSSEKLRLLVFLCDETLDTLQLRSWMEEQNQKFSEKKKEAKEKLLAAKEKEKLIKRELQEELVKAVIAKNGVPLSVSEHEALVSKVKAESKRARAEMLETMGLVPKYENAPDAVRIEPVYVDSKGNAYWRLKGCNKLDLLRQDVQGADSDKWFSFEVKEMQVIDERISFSRSKAQRRCRTSAPKKENGNVNPEIDLNEIPDLSPMLNGNDGCETNGES